jgi:hypothetical protein
MKLKSWLCPLGVAGVMMAVACGGSREPAEHPEGPMEAAGEDVDQAAEETRESLEEAGEETGDALEEAGDTIEDQTEREPID